jgi:DNA-binding response OmpR family regulator
MKRSLVMIEDDEQIRHLVGLFLKRKSWDFHGAATGAEGLEKTSSLRPDIILLDVQLPDAEGWDICRQLKGNPSLSETPVIMVSGRRTSPDDKAQGLEAGADDFLSKPFNLTELFLRMETILKARGK